MLTLIKWANTCLDFEILFAAVCQRAGSTSKPQEIGWGDSKRGLGVCYIKKAGEWVKIKHLEQYLPKAALGSILPKAVSSPLHVSLLFNWYPEFAAHSFHSIFGSRTYTKQSLWNECGICYQNGDSFQGLRVGCCVTLRNELSKETRVLTKQKTLLVRGAWAEGSSIREQENCSDMWFTVSALMVMELAFQTVSGFCLYPYLVWLRILPGWKDGFPRWLSGKESACNAWDLKETRVWSLSWVDPLEKEMATNCKILAWRTLWTEEAGRLQLYRLQTTLCSHKESDTTEQQQGYFLLYLQIWIPARFLGVWQDILWMGISSFLLAPCRFSRLVFWNSTIFLIRTSDWDSSCKSLLCLVKAVNSS